MWSGAMVDNVSYKNSAAIASVDFPQENQTQQVRKVFRFKTGLSIVFICCCEIVPPVRVSRPVLDPLHFVFKILIFLPLKKDNFTCGFFYPFE